MTSSRDGPLYFDGDLSIDFRGLGLVHLLDRVVVQEVLEDMVDRPDDKAGISFVIAHGLAGRMPSSHRVLLLSVLIRKTTRDDRDARQCVSHKPQFASILQTPPDFLTRDRPSSGRRSNGTDIFRRY